MLKKLISELGFNIQSLLRGDKIAVIDSKTFVRISKKQHEYLLANNYDGLLIFKPNSVMNEISKVDFALKHINAELLNHDTIYHSSILSIFRIGLATDGDGSFSLNVARIDPHSFFYHISSSVKEKSAFGMFTTTVDGVISMLGLTNSIDISEIEVVKVTKKGLTYVSKDKEVIS